MVMERVKNNCSTKTDFGADTLRVICDGRVNVVLLKDFVLAKIHL